MMDIAYGIYFGLFFGVITYLKDLPAIEQGYSQHMIAKVLGLSQQAVYGVE